LKHLFISRITDPFKKAYDKTKEFISKGWDKTKSIASRGVELFDKYVTHPVSKHLDKTIEVASKVAEKVGIKKAFEYIAKKAAIFGATSAAGTPLLGTIATIGSVLWDIYDIYSTANSIINADEYLKSIGKTANTVITYSDKSIDAAKNRLKDTDFNKIAFAVFQIPNYEERVKAFKAVIEELHRRDKTDKLVNKFIETYNTISNAIRGFIYDYQTRQLTEKYIKTKDKSVREQIKEQIYDKFRDYIEKYHMERYFEEIPEDALANIILLRSVKLTELIEKNRLLHALQKKYENTDWTKSPAEKLKLKSAIASLHHSVEITREELKPINISDIQKDIDMKVAKETAHTEYIAEKTKEAIHETTKIATEKITPQLKEYYEKTNATLQQYLPVVINNVQQGMYTATQQIDDLHKYIDKLFDESTQHMIHITNEHPGIIE
jgi:hypothetical protein